MKTPRNLRKRLWAGSGSGARGLLWALLAGTGLVASAAPCFETAVALRGKSLQFNPTTGGDRAHAAGSYQVFFAAEGDTYVIAAGDGFPAAYGRWSLATVAGQNALTLSDFPLSDGSHVEASTSLQCEGSSVYQAILFVGGGGSLTEAGTFTLAEGTAPVLEGIPTIVTQPSAATVVAGGNATFTVSATGAGTLGYQWYRNGSTLISGATASSYTLTNAAASDAVEFVVRVSNALGSVFSSGAALTVNVPPTTEPLVSYEQFVGQDITLGVSVRGTPPFAFQWNFNDVAIENATNQNLALTNLLFSQAGFYSVTVSNAFGATTTSNTTLSVLTLPLPTLLFGDYQTNTAIADVRIPVYYSAQGTETNLSFSFGFDPAVLTNASFEGSVIRTICSCTTMNNGSISNLVIDPLPVGPGSIGRGGVAKPAFLVENTQVYLDTTQVSTGRVGVRIVLPEGQRFAPEYSNQIGVLTFKYVPGITNIFAGRVAFAEQPEPIKYAPTNSLGDAPLTKPLLPVWASGAPVLNRQSGLIEQSLEMTNPGDLLANVRLYGRNIGVDSRTNAIRLQNAIGSTVIGTEVVPVADLGGIGPGETRRFTLEYYVSDRQATNVNPTLQFRSVPAATVTPSGTELAIHNYRFTNGVFLVEFPTRAGYRYYVQYAPDVGGEGVAEFKTSLPAVFGTGSYVQWLDNGPPKTDVLPANGRRLYRLIETR